MSKTASQGKAKAKFGHLIGPDLDEKDGEDGEEEDGMDGAEADGEEEDGEEGGYDLKSCAHDIMAAVQSGDVDALEEALEELMEKHGE